MSLLGITDKNLRDHVACLKIASKSPTTWSSSVIPPKIGPYRQGRPPGRGATWKSVTAISDSVVYHVLAIANDDRGAYQAFLTLQGAEERYMIARLETHPSHPGIHAHTWCQEDSLPACPASIEAPCRIPRVGQSSATHIHEVFTSQSFWNAVCKKFNVHWGTDDLFDQL